jgi:hypothetical protein
MSGLFVFLGNLDPVRVAVVFGACYFLHYAMTAWKPLDKVKQEAREEIELRAADHMSPEAATKVVKREAEFDS